MDSKALADKIVEILDSKKGIDIEVIDVFGSNLINKDNVEIYTSDGLHPSAEGYKALAEFIAKSLKGNE